jgi:hypothetical protein
MTNGATDALDRVHRPETDVVNAENRIMDAFVSIKTTVRRIKTAIITVAVFNLRVLPYPTGSVFVSRDIMVKHAKSNPL